MDTKNKPEAEVAEPLKLKIRRVRTRLAAGVRTGLAAASEECNPYCGTSDINPKCSRTDGIAD